MTHFQTFQMESSFFFFRQKLKNNYPYSDDVQKATNSITDNSKQLLNIGDRSCSSQYRGLDKRDVWERGKKKGEAKVIHFSNLILQWLNYSLSHSISCVPLNVYSS